MTVHACRLRTHSATSFEQSQSLTKALQTYILPKSKIHLEPSSREITTRRVVRQSPNRQLNCVQRLRMTLPIDKDNSIEFQPARFNIDLGLPVGDSQLLNEAAASLRQEFRSSSKRKRLRCRKLSVFAERDRGTIYVVHIGRSVEFDWTWEGATAFRPRSMNDDVSSCSTISPLSNYRQVFRTT